MKKPTPAQLAARAKFAEMARSGAFKRKAKRNPAKKTVSEKISQLTREGYPQKQAIAIALNEERAGKVKATPRKRNPRAANPIDPMGGYGPFYGQSIEGMTESKIEYIAERYMDRLDRDLMSGAITAAQYERDTKALNKWVKEAMSKRKRNPATGTKKSRTKLNPSSSGPYKYVCIAPLEYSGSKYGIDERTPVTMKFTKTEPAAHLVYACYKLPAELVKNQDFQDFAYDYPIFYMSLAELKVRLKEFLK